VKIIGPDLTVLEDLARQVMAQMTQVAGVQDLGVFHTLGQPNLNIKIDRARAARYGLNTGDVNTVIQAAMGGAVASQVLEGDRSFNLTVRLAPAYRTSMEAVGDIKVGYQTSSGATAYIPLRELATISLDSGASYIYHEAMYRDIPVKFSVRGRDLGGTVAEAQDRIARNVKLPRGYRIEWAGEFEDLQLAKKRLEIVVPVSLALIMVLLFSLFNAVRESLLALAGIPFAIAGGIFALFVAGLPFSVSAAIGFISLFGVSVMDGIIVITFFNTLRTQGMEPRDAMEHAAENRMRPMLMTALSACIGLVPAALSTGIGSQVQRPLATVVVGGMLLGPIMLLVVVPALRMLFLREEPAAGRADQPPAQPPAPLAGLPA
jgi:cobalt-zinc-cadmium resistance protein CzcA